jgi:prepilin-type N-terminal cleavage/methylation domain-containing protein
MKRGFTLLELVIVIIIIGVLATLGIQQYGRMVERARGAEARTILGQIRGTAAAYYLEHHDLANMVNDNAAGLGTGADQIPNACLPTHYFAYAITTNTADHLVAQATRCTSGGKTPDAPSALTLTLDTTFGTGVDTWGGTGGY